MYDISRLLTAVIRRAIVRRSSERGSDCRPVLARGGTAAYVLTGAAASCCLKELIVNRKQPAREADRPRAAFSFYKRGNVVSACLGCC